MTEDIKNAPRVSRDDLITYMESGCKPPDQWACGTEYEKFAYRRQDLKPLDYNGAQGIEALLYEFHRRFGWDPILDDGHIVGLQSPEGQPKASITTEPAGQVELSGKICRDVHENAAEIELYHRQMAETGKALNVGFLGIGYAPSWKLTDMQPIPKARYAVISRYMVLNSVMGIDMMYRSCTVQVNMDFCDEADMVQKMRLGLALQPLASALFATSPFMDGAPTRFITNRVNVWRYCDPARCGLLPLAFEDGFGFERYVDYALDVPLYFVCRDERYIDARGQTFRDFLNGQLEVLPGELPTMSDWELHLTTVYPEARLKKFIEMRGADSGYTLAHLSALPAFWTGILYDAACRDAAWDIAKAWSENDRDVLQREVIRRGISGTFQGQPVLNMAARLVEIAQQGLASRRILNGQGRDETHFLDVLRDRIDSGKTAADRLLDLYHGAWGGDINKIFSLDEANLPD